jgi:multidrug efflux pump subunit AcrA (membrane-fusion protein)
MIRHYLFPVVGIILGFSACRSSETNEKQVLMVKTETVKNYENELQVTYPGRVKAAADVDLAFRVAGPIIRIPVQVGSFVRKGEVIAEIDPRDYELPNWTLRTTRCNWTPPRPNTNRLNPRLNG